MTPHADRSEREIDLEDRRMRHLRLYIIEGMVNEVHSRIHAFKETIKFCEDRIKELEKYNWEAAEKDFHKEAHREFWE